VEVTTLVIPDYNDSEEVLGGIASFISSVDKAIPWHVSRFHPTYKLLDKPRTPVATLVRARQTGLSAGLKFVYTGNVPGDAGESTFCPVCSALLVERAGYRIEKKSLVPGKCMNCGARIEGVWV
jgi:pyruvate formate lyase activating enzyme